MWNATVLDLQKVIVQLERLGRHYNHSVRNYDEISLLDLSHALRIWADLKVPLREFAPKFATTSTFKTAIPPKKLLRAARGNQFIFACMPGRVITFASKELVSGPTPAPWHQSVEIRRNEDGSTALDKFYFVGAVLEEPIRGLGKTADQTRCNYENWLGSEAVRVCYADDAGRLQEMKISREKIIRRVANTLDGSHPSVVASVGDVKEKDIDSAIRFLLQFKMGGLPLPYFILLKIAQDILSVAPKLLGLEPAQDTK